MSEQFVRAGAAPIVKAADLIDKLPPPAAERLAALRTARERSGDLLRAASARTDEARTDFRSAADYLQRLERDYRNGRIEKRTIITDLDPLKWLPEQREVHEAVRIEPDEKRMQAERGKVARLRSDWQRRQKELDALSETMNAYGLLLTSVESYIAGLPHSAAIEIDDGGAIKPPKGDIAAAVDHAREQRRALAEELVDVRDAPRPSAEVKAAIAARVADLARRGQPDIENFLTDLHSLQFKNSRVTDLSVVLAKDGTTGVVVGSQPDALSTLLWACQDAITEKLCRLVDDSAEDDCALTPQDRAARTMDLKARILEVERVECAMLELAAERGVTLLPRADCDPRAFLALSSALPEPKRS